MGLYLRKSFKAGPVRFNLSRSGIGVSAGVKGLRVGSGPRGAYVHAGRKGLYYRKQLSSGGSANSSGELVKGFGVFALVLVAIGACLVLMNWLVLHPRETIIGTVFVLGISVLMLWKRLRQKSLLNAYKEALDTGFVISASPPDITVIDSIIQMKKGLPKNDPSRKEVKRIENNVYEAVLDRILDDGFISKEEASTIGAAERVLDIDLLEQMSIKKDIFSAAYIEAVEDSRITDDEMKKINNLIDGLGIPREDVRVELDTAGEIMNAQSLKLPLDTVSIDGLPVTKQENEDVFHHCPAQVLSRRKSKNSAGGYEYTLKREGIMVITNKRFFVTDNGTTSVRYSEIADLEVDIDRGIIEVLKTGSGRPVVIRTSAPIYTGRMIELLMGVQP